MYVGDVGRRGGRSGAEVQGATVKGEGVERGAGVGSGDLRVRQLREELARTEKEIAMWRGGYMGGLCAGKGSGLI